MGLSRGLRRDVLDVVALNAGRKYPIGTNPVLCADVYLATIPMSRRRSSHGTRGQEDVFDLRN